MLPSPLDFHMLGSEPTLDSDFDSESESDSDSATKTAVVIVMKQHFRHPAAASS